MAKAKETPEANATEPPPKVMYQRSAIIPQQQIAPKSVGELLELCRLLYAGGCTPEGVSRPEHLAPIILTGTSVGLSVMASIANVTPPVNGRCNLFGDAGLALARGSGQLAKLHEYREGEGDDRKAVCIIQRQGYDAKTFEYPLRLAKNLRSYKKQNEKKMGPWYDDADNMLRWRALWRALRTEFTDVLMGMGGAEESDDEPATPPAAKVEVVCVTTNPTAAYDVSVMDPPAFTPVAGSDAVTDDQLAEIARLRDMWVTSNSFSSDAEKKSRWVALLTEFGTTSALSLSFEHANAFIRTLGIKCDPLTYTPAIAAGTTETTAA